MKFSFIFLHITAQLEINNQNLPLNFDNNLPPYQTKLARISVECTTDPSLLHDCVVGQKWKCINEDGRWRKHKCKFYREVQNHLAEVNKYLNVHSKRNCACFTPDGVVYTKIKTEREFFKPKQKRFDRHRHHLHTHHRQRSKRSTTDDADEILIQHLPSEFLELLSFDRTVGNLQTALLNQSNHGRSKRETKDYVMQTLDELSALLGSIERKYANSSSDPVQCFVESSGLVNCSTNVYENEEAWRQSRTQIDMLIKLLKNKITDLKDIKKHLKEHRPMNMTYDEENYENFSLSAEDIEEHLKLTSKSPKRKFKFTELPSATEISSTSTTTTQKQRNRTKRPSTEGISTTVTESTTSTTALFEESSNFSFMTELNFDYSTLATVGDLSAIIHSSTNEMLSTTTSSEVIRETLDYSKLVSTGETTRVESKLLGNEENPSTTTTMRTSEDEKKVPAECFCEPEPNK